MLNFNFSEKSLGLVFPSHFLYDFPMKMLLIWHSINRPNFIVWLTLLFEILGNLCITIVCLPGCNLIKFEINLSFLIKPFCYMTKKSRQKLKYLETEKSFWGEIKGFIIIFEGLSVAKKCLRPVGLSLRHVFYILSFCMINLMCCVGGRGVLFSKIALFTAAKTKYRGPHHLNVS